MDKLLGPRIETLGMDSMISSAITATPLVFFLGGGDDDDDVFVAVADDVSFSSLFVFFPFTISLNSRAVTITHVQL